MEESWSRLNANIILARRQEGYISILVSVVVNIIIYFVLSFFQWPMWISWLMIVISIIIIPYDVLIAPKWKYETCGYKISETNIQIKVGKIFEKEVLIPMKKVQHVELSQGPLLKKYQLMKITISTAAGSHEVTGIAEDVAEEIRKEIEIHARLYDEQI